MDMITKIILLPSNIITMQGSTVKLNVIYMQKSSVGITFTSGMPQQ